MPTLGGVVLVDPATGEPYKAATTEEVASQLADPNSELGAALSSTYASVLKPIAGESATAATARINAALAANPVVRLVGDFTHNGPIVVPSNTVLDWSAGSLTLANGSACNGIVNAAVVNARRVMDAVANSTTTITSATAAFTSADVGKRIAVWQTTGVPHVTTIASVTNGTTAVLAAACPTSGTALYASIGDRDHNIRLVPGRTVRAAGNDVYPLLGWNSNHLRFRHVDGLTIESIPDIVTLSGKYAVNVGDCTGVEIDSIYTSGTYSDVLHINGPCSKVNVGSVTSMGSRDDIVSLTGGDFTTIHQMADCQGDITDVHVGTINSEPSTHPSSYTRGLVILPGRNSDATYSYKVKRVTVDKMATKLKGWPVAICDDTQDNNTKGGTCEDITICPGGGVNLTPPAGAAGTFVAVAKNNVTNLTIGPVRNEGTWDVTVYAGVTVTNLSLVGTLRKRVMQLGAIRGALNISGDLPYGPGDQKLYTLPREIVAVQSIRPVSGTVHLTYFRPANPLAVNGLTTITRGTAASGTSMARLGLYSVDLGTGALTLITSTTNDTSLWVSTFQRYTRSWSAGVTLDPSLVYALGVLWIGTTSPALVGIQGDGDSLFLADRMAADLTSQTDLPASIAGASLTGSSGCMLFGRLG